MAFPPYTGLGGKITHYGFLIFCACVFLFLIAPILVIIPLSFNAEPYFTFTEGMMALIKRHIQSVGIKILQLTHNGFSQQKIVSL